MSGPAFELLRFEAAPATAAVAVVELDGRFAGADPVRPRLLVESGGVAMELPALVAGGDPWSATFAIPLSALVDGDASFALVPGRGPLVALPSPTRTGGADDDRFVRIARDVNVLRHQLREARAAGAAFDERVDAVAAERDALANDLDEARARLAAAEERAASSHDAALTAREEQARAEGEADEAREALERARAEARLSVQSELEASAAEVAAAREQLREAQDRAIAAEDDARAARRDLRDARGRIESLLRQSRTTRGAAARARVPSRAMEDDEFHAARLGPDWAEDDDTADGAPLDDPTAVLRDDDEAAADGDPEEREGGPPGDDHTQSDDPAAPGSAPDDDSASHSAGSAPLDDPTDPRHGGSPAGSAPLDDPAPDDDESAPHSAGSAPLDEDDRVGEPSGSVLSGSSDDRAARLDRRDDTAPHAPAAGDAPTTAELSPVDSPALWTDESDSVRVLRPRTRAGKPVRIADDADDDDDVLEPAAVGARAIRPAETPPHHRAVAILSNPRVIVGGIFFLLIVALILIFLGVGPV